MIQLTHDVKSQLRKVRNAAGCNMLDIQCVQRYAVLNDYYALVIFCHDHIELPKIDRGRSWMAALTDTFEEGDDDE